MPTTQLRTISYFRFPLDPNYMSRMSGKYNVANNVGISAPHTSRGKIPLRKVGKQEVKILIYKLRKNRILSHNIIRFGPLTTIG